MAAVRLAYIWYNHRGILPKENNLYADFEQTKKYGGLPEWHGQ